MYDSETNGEKLAEGSNTEMENNSDNPENEDTDRNSTSKDNITNNDNLNSDGNIEISENTEERTTNDTIEIIDSSNVSNDSIDYVISETSVDSIDFEPPITEQPSTSQSICQISNQENNSFRKSANSNDESASCSNKSSKQIDEGNKSLIEVVNLDNTDSTVELSDDEDSIAEVSQENDDDLEMDDCESNPAVQLNSDAFISEIAQNEEVCWSTDSWSGSGIWERTENRRWIAVHKHIIPGRKRSVSESSLIRDLGTGQFVDRFESSSDQSESSEQFRIVTSRESMIRLRALVPGGQKCQEPRPSTSRQFDDPVPGPSSAPQSQGETGDEENRSSPPPIIDIIQVEEGENVVEARNNQRIRNRLLTPARRRRNQRKSRLAKKRQRRRYNMWRNFGHSQRSPRQSSTPQKRITLTQSADSSPGRDSPSPNSLARICLYWEKRLASPEYVIHSDPESEP